MKRKRHRSEQIAGKLREADRLKSEGKDVGQICQQLEVSEQTYHRWKNAQGQGGLDQVKKLKDLEKENARLKQAVAVLMLDRQIQREMIDDLGR